MKQDTPTSITAEAPAPSFDEKIITINGMHKWFGDFHVLKNINLEVHRGERIVICGPSGSNQTIQPAVSVLHLDFGA